MTLLLCLLWLFQQHPPTPPAAAQAQPGPGLREVFPGVRADVHNKLVEFDATITPMLVKDDQAPLFYLEVLACSPNTREHETIVVTDAKPSHIHAALLAIGLKPGSPGSWTFKDNTLTPVQPRGDRVTVRIAWTDAAGTQHEADPLDWVVSAKDRTSFLAAETKLAPRNQPPGWLFAGSRFVTKGDSEAYDADGSGTVIGLTTFGSEVIAWSRVISPDAETQPPEWIADLSHTPPAETRVTVRIRPAG